MHVRKIKISLWLPSFFIPDDCLLERFYLKSWSLGFEDPNILVYFHTLNDIVYLYRLITSLKRNILYNFKINLHLILLGVAYVSLEVYVFKQSQILCSYFIAHFTIAYYISETGVTKVS